MKSQVLVVEDDEGLRELLKAVLRPHCSRIDMVTDGEEAISALRRQPYDLLILDIMLPRANGFVVADMLRTLPKRPQLIVMSAIARYCEDRFPPDTIILQKPFDVTVIEAVVNRLNAALGPQQPADVGV